MMRARCAAQACGAALRYRSGRFRENVGVSALHLNRGWEEERMSVAWDMRERR